MLQASSRDVRSVVGVPQSRAIVRRGRIRRIDARVSRRLDSHDAVVSLEVCNEWPIVQQAIAGNANAQERLFGRNTDKLYRTAFSVLRNREDAEDAVQDGLCKAYASLQFFRGRSSFSTWLDAHRHKRGPDGSPQEECATGGFAGRDSRQSARAVAARSLRCATRPGEDLCGEREQCTRRRARPPATAAAASGISAEGDPWSYHRGVEQRAGHPCKCVQSSRLSGAREASSRTAAIA